MYRIGSGALALVTTLAIAACTVERAPTVEGTPPPGDAYVVVQLDEFSIEMPDQVPAGTVSFRIENSGEMEHSFAIEGGDVSDELVEPVAPGETFDYTMQLPPGTYTVWCPIGDHREQGMEATFDVTEGAGESGEAGGSGAPLFDEGVDPSEQEAPITDDYSAP
jgi:plastocyanin